MLLIAATQNAVAGDIKGKIMDSELNEPLMGAAIRVVGTNKGTTADLDGNFVLKGLKKGEYTLQISYISFHTQTITVSVPNKGEVSVTVDMKPDNKELNEVTVTARKNLELERVLLAERKQASIAIENLGAGEMSIKGLSNVQEGVKRITGISVAEAGQLIVRGLGDRYSITTLNGMPIASPNPDNKLIPLDIFPSSTVQNITVSKVYSATTFADYSGAHVDIGTKEHAAEDFFSLSIGTGGNSQTTFQERYQMDRSGTLFTTPGMDQKAANMSLIDFDNYARKNNLFETSFQTKKYMTLPNVDGSFGLGKNFELNRGTLSLLTSMGVSTGFNTVHDAFVKTFEATGNQKSEYYYNKYSQDNKLTGLMNLGYQFKKADRIGGTFFYARNVSDTYMDRNGVDEEEHVLSGSHQTTHIYMLQNYQLHGHHEFGSKWRTDWGGSYNRSSSNEPDRRQVMFQRTQDGKYKLFTLNQQETMRYFGNLNENEWVGDLKAAYHFNDKDKLQAGFSYKNKSRDFSSISYYYDLEKLNSLYGPFEHDNIYNTDAFLNFDEVQKGNITISRNKVPSNSYQAGNIIYAGFLDANVTWADKLLLNAGVRMESSSQWVYYYEDGSSQQKKRELNTNDFFPALNIKYEMNKKNSLRLAASRTVTRPSFIEMAPFRYQESYGSANLRGNANLNNGYNYNVDLRYEWFGDNGTDMIAVTGYYKYLETPIERTQWTSGGAREYSFQNADDGLAAGIELEIKKNIIKNLNASINASYMYTNVQLPEGGVYTNTERQLQGASPYLVNADISYTPTFKKDRKLTLALLYNLQGERIQAVGIAQQGDVVQEAINTLNLNIGYQFNKKLSAKIQIKNLTNSDIVMTQELPEANKTVEVERYKEGISFDFGLNYKF